MHKLNGVAAEILLKNKDKFNSKELENYLNKLCEKSSLEIFNTILDYKTFISRIDDNPKVQQFWSSALKSNCRVTSQPDFGDVYIHYKGKYKISQENLLQYIVSFRDECHFHEEICETIYKRLYDLFEPQELMVACLNRIYPE